MTNKLTFAEINILLEKWTKSSSFLEKHLTKMREKEEDQVVEGTWPYSILKITMIKKNFKQWVETETLKKGETLSEHKNWIFFFIFQ